jgi:hypothetical protein
MDRRHASVANDKPLCCAFPILSGCQHGGQEKQRAPSEQVRELEEQCASVGFALICDGLQHQHRRDSCGDLPKRHQPRQPRSVRHGSSESCAVLPHALAEPSSGIGRRKIRHSRLALFSELIGQLLPAERLACLRKIQCSANLLLHRRQQESIQSGCKPRIPLNRIGALVERVVRLRCAPRDHGNRLGHRVCVNDDRRERCARQGESNSVHDPTVDPVILQRHVQVVHLREVPQILEDQFLGTVFDPLRVIELRTKIRLAEPNGPFWVFFYQ